MYATLPRPAAACAPVGARPGLDFRRKFLPDHLSGVHELDFLDPSDARLLSQVQGRTYANVFALFGRGEQEPLLHIAQRAGAGMPRGYVLKPQWRAIGEVVRGRSTWALRALTLHVELAPQAHCRSSFGLDPALCALWGNAFLAVRMQGSQHARGDELAWRAEHARLDAAQREAAVDDLVAVVGAADALCRAQAVADVDYFLECSASDFSPAQEAAIRDLLLKAYRWQYIVSATQEPQFSETLVELVTPQQLERIGAALAPILAHASA